MANYLKSMIEVHGNEAVTNKVDEMMENIEYSDVASFAKAFYDNVGVGENGEGVLNQWSVDNLGSKWTYLYDKTGYGAFSVESAWYPPLRFFVHLYNMMVELDPDVIIEVRYEDESYNPVGAVLIKKNGSGEPVMYQEEDTEMEYPDEDDYWDDDEDDVDYDAYEDAEMNFMEELAERQNELLAVCYDMISEGDGDPINEVE